MKHYTDNTLMELLKHPDQTVQRHAKGIEARMHAIELEQLEYTNPKTCQAYCPRPVYRDGLCKECFEFYNK